ncbi:hypothetical protein Tco_0675304, partial [Tanacetum coccineum]
MLLFRCVVMIFGGVIKEELNTGGLGVSTGSGPVSSARGQREGKDPMIVEET